MLSSWRSFLRGGWPFVALLLSLGWENIQAGSSPAESAAPPGTGSGTAGGTAGGPAGGTGGDPAGLGLSSASIEIRSGPVYAGGVVRARVRSSAAPDVKVQWKADAGLLLYDDLPEVEWRAPTRAGSCTLWVTLSLAKETLQTSVKVDVKSPSTEGMVFVPRGTFLRGDVRGTANKAEIKTLQNSSDEPCHSVYLDDYYIDRLLVTNQEYKEFLEDSLARGLARVEDIAVTGEFDGSWVPFYYFRSFEDLIPQYHETRNARKPEFLHEISWDGSKLKVKAGKESCPVVDVSWFGAAAYAHFHGKSLPTEAQWEKAARGTDGRRYPWGNNLPTSYHANLNSQAGAEPTPVGNYSPAGDSPYGAADMLGGLFEWTNDWFNADYYSDYLGEAPFRNPAGPFWGRSHTIRGAPLTLQFPQAPSDSTEAVSFRYSWRFEFFIADIFGNRQTGFRTVVVAGGSR